MKRSGRRRRSWLGRVTLGALLVVLCATIALPVYAADVTVFAAASLKEALDDQARQFESATGNKVIVSYGGSNTLAKQIESGAPADLFISADLDWMDYLDQRHLIAPNTRYNLLRNSLELIAPVASTSTLTIARNFGLAAALGSDKLAMANPDSVPAGKYGKSALEFLGVWASVEKQVARADNVRAALALVSRGEAPFGIVYRTDALADKGVKVVDTFPPDSHPPIVYPVALVADSKSSAAKALLEFLRTAAARPSWEKYGFGMAQ
jgi:molybdate transport system substrate-binding protein